MIMKGMLMTGVRLLDPPHKGIRHLLGQFSLVAGRTDYTDLVELAELRDLAHRVLTLLEEHARNEDDVIFPMLEAKSPGATSALHDDHSVLDASLESIVSRLDAMDGTSSREDAHALYLDVTEFQARYLLHLVREERDFEPQLWPRYTDDELRAGEAVIAQTMSPELLMAWFTVCAPARTITENREVLTNVKGVLPPEIYAGIIETLRPEFPAGRLETILEGVE
jgi:hypothetical protein